MRKPSVSKPRAPEGPPIAVEIHALAAGGDAVGRDEGGRAVFVAGAVPGEHVQVRLRETHARWARGELVSVMRPVAARVEPPCPLFASRACGGCQWQHVHDAVQHAQKLAIVTGALRKLVAAGLTLRPLLAPVAPYRWRRRARFAVQGTVIGFHAPRDRGICDVPACLQLEPALEAVLQAIRAADAVDGDGEIHAIVGADGAHVVFDVACDAARAAALAGQAGIAGVAWREGAAGAPTVEIEPGLAARGDDFAQASRAGNDALRALVREAMAATPGERVLELYAGGGNFTRDLAAAGASVVASDERAPANAPSGFIAGNAATVVRDLVARRARFDGVLLDPPRTGAKDVVTQLAALGPARVVYVSCDPATLARDAEHLAAAGLAPRWAQPLDLMPQTAHVELVARFERT